MTIRTLARAGVPGMMLWFGLLVSGCTTVDGKLYWIGQEPKTDNARQELLQRQAQRESAIMRSRLDGLEQSQARLIERMDRMEALNRDNAKLHDELVGMRRELAQMRGERDTMRQEIVDALTTRINKYMATYASGGTGDAGTGAGRGTQNGYMHTVAAGQTLGDIAKAYKTTVAAIRKANNLKSDNLKVGQTLFIPE